MGRLERRNQQDGDTASKVCCIAIGIEVLTKEEPETTMKINVLEHRCDSMQRQIDYRR